MIPASLCVLAIAVSFGPWGAFSVARQSQVKRLEKLTTEAGILVDGKIRPAKAEIPFDQTKQISAVLAYLQETHGYDEIQGWFAQSLRDDTSSSGLPYKTPDAVVRMMGLQYVTNWGVSPGGFLDFRITNAYDPRGYDRMAFFQMWRGEREVKFAADSISYHVSANMDSITFSALPSGRALVRIDLLGHAKGLAEKYRSKASDRISTEDMMVQAAGNSLRVRICPSWIQLQQHNGKTELTVLHGIILYSVEKPVIQSAAIRDTSTISRH